MQNQIELKRLFGKFSGAHITPPQVVELQGEWYMYPVNNNGDVCLSSSQDGVNWSEPVRIFSDWGSIKGAPSVIQFQEKIWMCVASGNGTILIAESSDGDSWPPSPKPILGDFRSPRSGPTLTIINAALYVIVLDHNGTPFIGKVATY